MKTKHLFFALLSAFFLITSCEEVEMEIPLEADVDLTVTSETRAMVSPAFGTKSKSNIDLYKNWENVTTIFLNGGGNIDAPWIVKQGNSMNIPDNIRTDIKKEIGWTMLGHTMTDKESQEPNYILFYHKKSGTLKGFYYSRTEAANESFRWVIAANKPTSMIPSNTKESNLTNNLMEFATTSNTLTPRVTSASGPLRSGWNCFTFELPYGPNNNNPRISIDGYNTLSLDLEANGSFSGQVIVPSVTRSNSLEFWQSHLSTVSNVSGAVDAFSGILKHDSPQKTANYVSISEMGTRSFLGILGFVKGAISTVSGLLGGASAFTSKKKTIINRYNFSGNMQITGTVVSRMQPGLVTSTNNFDIMTLNNNEALGVWGLKEYPKMTINKYDIGLQKDDPKKNDTYYRRISLIPEIKKESVIINPSLLRYIESYSVSTNYFYSFETPFPILDSFSTNITKVDDDWFVTEIPNGPFEISKNVDISGYLIPVGQFPMIYLSYINAFPKLFINVLVTINYKKTDGDVETFNSSRIFKIDAKVYDNRNEILSSKPKNAYRIFL